MKKNFVGTWECKENGDIFKLRNPHINFYDLTYFIDEKEITEQLRICMYDDEKDKSAHLVCISCVEKPKFKYDKLLIINANTIVIDNNRYERKEKENANKIYNF